MLDSLRQNMQCHPGSYVRFRLVYAPLFSFILLLLFLVCVAVVVVGVALVILNRGSSTLRPSAQH